MRKDALERRNRILAAACDLYASGGPTVSLEKIAEKAGVGIATLYRNFPTRHDLLTACIEDLCAQVCAKIDAAVEDMRSGVQDPERILLTTVARTVPAGINILVPSLIEPDESTLSPETLALRKQLGYSLDGLLETARSFGFIHDTVDNDWVINGLLHLYQVPAFRFTSSGNISETAQPLVAIFLEGCQKGLEDSFQF